MNNKKEVLVYENGQFIKGEIEWIEKTDETTRKYMQESYYFEGEEEYQHLLSQIEPSENEINDLCRIIHLEKSFDTEIRIYQHFKEYAYIIFFQYPECTYNEWYACKDFKTLLAFLKEIEPLLNLIEQSDTIGHLEVLKDQMYSILKPEDYTWIKDEKKRLSHLLGDFEYLVTEFEQWIAKTKRKKFVLNDLCKEVIKANKEKAKK